MADAKRRTVRQVRAWNRDEQVGNFLDAQDDRELPRMPAELNRFFSPRPQVTPKKNCSETMRTLNVGADTPVLVM